MNRTLSNRIARLEVCQPQGIEAMTDDELDDAIRWLVENLGGLDIVRQDVPPYLLPALDAMIREEAGKEIIVS